MKRTNQKNEIQERVIYLLISPDHNNFLVGHCSKDSITETYRHNLKGRRDTSKEFINHIKPERPCLFILESITGTTYDASNLVLVWIKIFHEKGYKCFNSASLIEMTKELYWENTFRYTERNNLGIQEITSCRNCQIPTYNRQVCKNYKQDLELKGE